MDADDSPRILEWQERTYKAKTLPNKSLEVPCDLCGSGITLTEHGNFRSLSRHRGSKNCHKIQARNEREAVKKEMNAQLKRSVGP